MHLTQKAKKAVAAGLALSTVMWSAAFFVALPAQAAPHSEGCIVLSGGTVWLLTGGQRRGFTSAEVFASHGYNFGQVVPANSEDEALPAGPIMVYADGSIVKGPSDPLVYLVANGQKRGFTSGSVFTGLGYSFANIQWAPVNTFSDLPTGANVESSTERHPAGTWVKDGTGTVWMMTSTGRKGVPSMEVFNSYGKSWATVVAANAADLAAGNEGVVTARATCTSGPSNPGTNLTVSAASGTPASATVPKGATNVTFLKFMVSNPTSSTGTVNSVTVHRTGAGSTSDFDNVYIYQGSSRLTSGRTVNSSTNDAVFSGLNISVPAMGSVTLDVVADINDTATAGNVHALQITSVLSGSTSASGSATGNNMTIAGVTAGTITAATSGTVTDPKVGEMNVKVAQFQLSAGSSEDLTIKRISLFNGGNINRSNISNFKLVQNGSTVATVSGFDSKDKVNFDVNFALEKGNSRTFEVMADISAAARTDDSIKLYFEESSDLYAVGNTFGFGAQVVNNFGSGQGTNLTLDGGQVTITFNGPSSKDIARDGRDIEVFSFMIAAQQTVDIRQLSLLITGTDLEDGTNALYTDIKVWDTASNTVVWGPQDVSGTGGNSQDLLFTEDVTINGGTSKNFKVTLDVANDSDVTSGETVTIALDMSDLSGQIKSTNNNTFLADADIVPSPAGADLTGNAMTVKIAGLTVSLAGTPTSQSFVKGSSNVPAVGFNFTAGTAKDVKVTALTLTCIIDGDNSGTGAIGIDGTNCSDDVTGVMLMDGDTQIGTTKSPTVNTGLVQFTGLNWNIPAGTTKTLVVKMNTSSSTAAPDVVKFGFVSDGTNLTGVTSSDSDGNALSVADATGVNISTTMTVGTNITIAAAGTIVVVNAPSEIDVTDSHIVIAGQTAVTLGKYRFTAASEELRVDKIQFSVAAGNIDEVSSLSLYDGATLVAGPVTPGSDGAAQFNSVNNFVVPKDGSKVMTVKANLNTISSGADSGATVQVTLQGQTSEGFEARGTGSSSTFIQVVSATASTGGDTAATGTMLVRKTKPTFALQPLPSTVLAVGTKVLYKFSVTADSAEQVALKQFAFTITVGGTGALTADSIAVREAGTVTNISMAAVNNDNAVGQVAFASEQVVPAGGTKTYEVLAGVATAAAGDSIAVSMANTGASTDATGWVSTGTAGSTPAPTYSIDDSNNSTVDGTVASLIWSDYSAVPHIDSPSVGTAAFTGSGDWANGWLVRTPTDTQTLVSPN